MAYTKARIMQVVKTGWGLEYILKVGMIAFTDELKGEREVDWPGYWQETRITWAGLKQFISGTFTRVREGCRETTRDRSGPQGYYD